MPWGVDVPNDPDHVMYVWFDALVFYISTLGWPFRLTDYQKFWPGVQVAGKDNLRQQSAIWQAMLMSARLPNTKQIFIHGFITSEGQKMSKSLGNVIDPIQLVKQYGIDSVRYYLLKEIPATGDGDFSHSRMKEIYNADLANGLGNLVSRLAKLCENSGLKFQETIIPKVLFREEQQKALENFEFNLVLSNIWTTDLRIIDRHIDHHQPWSIRDDSTKHRVLQEEIDDLRLFAKKIEPFLPHTAKKILEQFSGPTIKSQPPLFPRIK